MTKVLSNVRLVLLNVIMEPSNVRKRIREPPNMTKEKSHVILELHSVRIEPSNVRKNKGIAEYDKSTVTCDVGIAQCEDGTVKCEKKKINEPPNVTKIVTCDVDITTM